MDFKGYPSYKDSGVEWLGEVPEHWKILQTRHLFSFGKGLTITKENLSDEGIPCINYGEIHSKYGFEFNPSDNPLKCVSHDYIESNKNCLLNEGDFIFADTSEDLEGSGNFSYLNQESIVFAGYHSIIARLKNHKNNARFFAYLFDSQAYRNQVRTEMKGVKVFSVSQGVLKTRFAWLPPNEEQVKIVSFLDSETSRIDNLIAKQEKLIEKLEEHRKSVIYHAVTKGLDPNVPMKDSGVEWLGKVPEHWNMLKSSYIFKVSKGKNAALLTKEYCATREQIYPVYSGQTENSGLMGMTDSYEYDCEENGGILSTTVGAKAMSVKYLDHKFNLSQNCMIIFSKNNDVYNNKFYYYFFQPLFHFYRNQIPDFMQPSFRMEDFYSYKIVSLTLDEQKKIVEYLDFENQKFDNLISKQQTLIEKLKEYRTSIISHAVTGKIDVRDLVA